MSRHHTVAKRKTEKESSFVWRAHSKRSWRTGGTVDGDGAGDEASEPSSQIVDIIFGPHHDKVFWLHFCFCFRFTFPFPRCVGNFLNMSSSHQQHLLFILLLWLVVIITLMNQVYSLVTN